MKKLIVLLLICTPLAYCSQKQSSGFSLSFPQNVTSAPQEIAKSIDLKAATEALKLQQTAQELAKGVTDAAQKLSDGFTDLGKNFGKGLDTKAIAEGVEKSTIAITKGLENGISRLSETADKAVVEIVKQTKQATENITAASKDAIKEFAAAFDLAKLERIAAHVAIKREDSLRLGLCVSTASSAASIAWNGFGCANSSILAGSLIVLYPDKAKEVARLTGKTTQRLYRRAKERAPKLAIVGNTLHTCWQTLTSDEDGIVIRPKTPTTPTTQTTLAQAPEIRLSTLTETKIKTESTQNTQSASLTSSSASSSSNERAPLTPLPSNINTKISVAQFLALAEEFHKTPVTPWPSESTTKKDK